MRRKEEREWLGCDFGTYSSGVAWVTTSGEVEVVGEIPTALYFPPFDRTRNVEIFFGHEAIEGFQDDPGGRLMFALKTLAMAEDFLGQNIKGYMGVWTAERLIRLCLIRLKAIAEARSGRKFNAVMLGRPVEFSEIAVNRLMRAAYEAGFKTVRFELEPVAAARAVTEHTSGRMVTVDAGGGTTDFLVADINGRHVQVLATGGIAQAGNAINSTLIEQYLLGYFGRDAKYTHNGYPVPQGGVKALTDWRKIQFVSPKEWIITAEDTTDPIAVRRLQKLYANKLAYKLFTAVGLAKEQLSERSEANLQLPRLGFVDEPKAHDQTKLTFTREGLASASKSIVQAMERELLATLRRADTSPAHTNTVILTGGTSQALPVQDMAAKVFGADKIKIVDPSNTVVKGLALRTSPHRR